LLADLAVVVDICCDDRCSIDDTVVKAKQKQKRYFVIKKQQM